MKNTERILLFAIAVGFGMDVIHIPFAGVVYSLGLALLALFYLGLPSLLLRGQEKGRHLLPLSVLGGLALAASVVAMLLKVQEWPGATLFALTGTALCITTLVVVLRMRSLRPDPASFFSNILVRILPALAFVGTLAAVTHYPAL